jgi:hypothetical protein
MKICKKCGNKFSFTAKINGKRINLQNRRYCLECSPFGIHNTKKLENKESKSEIECVCQICNREYIWVRSKGSTRTTCNSCLVNNSRIKLKKNLVEYKGGKCEVCGIIDKDHYSIYDFHHTNPKEKDMLISGSYCRSLKILKKEVDKCILVCSNCHRIIHEDLRKEDLRKI